MKYNYKKPTTKTVNLAGGEAYKQSPKLELVSLLLTSFVKDQFYRSEGTSIKQLQDLIPAVEKDFAAKAAVFARNEFGMRSISHVLTAELFRKPPQEGCENYLYGLPWAKDFVAKVIRRPDDATEIMAYYTKNVKEKAIPAALKKGIAKALTQFDEYQLGKYNSDHKAYKLVDLVNLTHPKGGKYIKKLVEGTLATPDTWETKLTKAGQKAEDAENKKELKKEAWASLISTRKIGYFALLRNLRNILEQAPEMTEAACDLLRDKKLIDNSLVLPFRYVTAYKELTKGLDVDQTSLRMMLMALDDAVELSLDNVPDLPNTLVVLDGSGSMSGEPAQIGSLFASVLLKKNNCDFIIFDTSAKTVGYNPRSSVMDLARSIEQTLQGGGTDFSCFFPIMKKAYDRIIILSDMQGWVGYNAPSAPFASYKKRTGADPFIYSFDLQGYGTTQFPENKIITLAGFSDKVFDLMKLFEQDREALVHKIEAVVL